MPEKTLKHLCVTALILLAVICLSSSAHAYPNGVSGASGKSGSNCTMCHSSGTSKPTVVISGPRGVTSGECEFVHYAGHHYGRQWLSLLGDGKQFCREHVE